MDQDAQVLEQIKKLLKFLETAEKKYGLFPTDLFFRRYYNASSSESMVGFISLTRDILGSSLVSLVKRGYFIGFHSESEAQSLTRAQCEVRLTNQQLAAPKTSPSSPAWLAFQASLIER